MGKKKTFQSILWDALIVDFVVKPSIVICQENQNNVFFAMLLTNIAEGLNFGNLFFSTARTQTFKQFDCRELNNVIR